MKRFVDRHRTERKFQVGDWVYLKLQYCRQGSVVWRNSNKLAPLFYGPFQVMERIGAVAYKLELLEGSQVHLVFSVSLLKKKFGNAQLAAQIQVSGWTMGPRDRVPKQIVGRKMVQDARCNQGAIKVLVK